MDTLHEHAEELTCPSGHVVEVHWTEGQQASHWLCPACLEDPDIDSARARIAFGEAK